MAVLSIIISEPAMVHALSVLNITNCVVSNYAVTAERYVTVTEVLLIMLNLNI
jgi:hypothetical protein